ncbi:hypothetical protein D1872_265130 [compost metagenome]
MHNQGQTCLIVRLREVYNLFALIRNADASNRTIQLLGGDGRDNPLEIHWFDFNLEPFLFGNRMDQININSYILAILLEFKRRIRCICTDDILFRIACTT